MISMNLIPILEGILFLVGDDGISNDKLKQILSIDDNKLLELITQLEKEYASPDRGLQLEKFGNSFKLTTKKEHKQYYEMLTVEETNGSLSPVLYGVTNNFLDFFGLKSTEELPEIKDVELSTEEKDLFESKYKEEL